MNQNERYIKYTHENEWNFLANSLPIKNLKLVSIKDNI
jgi:hypothetical protein